MLRSELKRQLYNLGIVVQGNCIKKSDITRILGEHYKIPEIPNELKHAKTFREKQYLKIVNDLLTIVKKDPMTGLEHKEHFKSSEKSPGVYILIDGDGLKKINDVFGHTAGHAAILAISDGIKAAIRPSDSVTVTRSGGDEFIVHLENVSIPAGVSIANRILENIHKQKISKHFSGDPKIKVELDKIDLGASLGVGYTEEEADKAMYQAKNKGRNRVEFYKQSAKKVAQITN